MLVRPLRSAFRWAMAMASALMSAAVTRAAPPLEQRYAVAGCLLQGKVYSEIRRETGASSATVSRVNRMLNYGTGSVAESVREDLAAQGIATEK